MRDPVLHIKRSDLVSLVKELRTQPRSSSEQFVDDIFLMATKRRLAIRDAYIVTNLKGDTKKKAMKTVNAEGGNVELFNRLLTMLRKKYNPKSTPAPILKDSRDYILMKEIAQMASQFCADFKLVPLESGYKDFIEIGIKLMEKKYALNKFKTYYARIYDAAECSIIVSTDPDKDKTRSFFQAWEKIILTYTNSPIKPGEYDYIHFFHARCEADEYSAKYADWIVAQFEGMKYLNTLPEIYQLYGSGARKRYEKWRSQKGITKATDLKLEENPENKAQQEYLKKLRENRANNNR